MADRARRRDWETALALFVPLESRAEEPVIPLSLLGSRTFASEALLMFFVGIGMFGVILYTPLFVHGVLGQSATNSGTFLTPMVFAMTAPSRYWAARPSPASAGPSLSPFSVRS